jgi:hypothetical protein
MLATVSGSSASSGSQPLEAPGQGLVLVRRWARLGSGGGKSSGMSVADGSLGITRDCGRGVGFGAAAGCLQGGACVELTRWCAGTKLKGNREVPIGNTWVTWAWDQLSA